MNIKRLALMATLVAWTAPVFAEEAPLDSPRLQRLAAELKAGSTAALAEFWAEVNGNAPLVEPIAGDDTRSWVTFLYRGDDKTRGVALKGGMPAAATFNPLARLPGTDVWHQTQRLPSDSRFTYLFVLDPPNHEIRSQAEAKQVFARIRFDPLNPRTFQKRPLVELPGAPPQPFLVKRPGVAAGLVKEHEQASAILKQRRKVTVYTPPGYDAKGEPLPVIVLFDGQAYLGDIPAPTILDNLIADKKLLPVVAVLVHQQDRMRELLCAEDFADFMATELMPWLRVNFHVASDPAKTVVGGLSAGGLMAVYCGLRHPKVFGNVLSQSGSFWYVPGAEKMLDRQPPPYAETGWLTRKLVEAPKQPLKFYLEVGRFEASGFAGQLAESRRLRDVLQAKGYDVVYSEYHGGHDAVNWRLVRRRCDGAGEVGGRREAGAMLSRALAMTVKLR
jgi:enterochelin esterase-like enzyme